MKATALKFALFVLITLFNKCDALSSDMKLNGQNYDITKNHFFSFLEVQQQVKNNKGDPASIQGSISINGQQYQTVCDCSGGLQQDEASSLVKCDPSKIKIQQNKDGAGATFEQIRQVVGHPNQLTYVNVAESSFYCLDGRIDIPVLATPGGDAGEFLLALHVFQESTNRKLSYKAVQTYLQTWLKTMKQEKFMMCTDDTAIDHIEKTTEINMNIQTLRSPQASNQNNILDALMQSANNGDTHFQLLLKNPEYYAIDIQLVQNFIKAYYTTLWDINNPLSQKLFLVGLVGNHNETAFLEVRSNEACNTAQIAPLIAPKEKKKNGIQVFVNDLDAISIRRYQLSVFFTSVINKQGEPIDPKVFHHRMNKNGLAFLEVTGSFIAKKLKFYTLNLV